MSDERINDIDADILQCKLDIVRIRQGILNSETRDAVVEFRPEDSIGMGAVVDDSEQETASNDPVSVPEKSQADERAESQPPADTERDSQVNIYAITRQEQEALMAELEDCEPFDAPGEKEQPAGEDELSVAAEVEDEGDLPPAVAESEPQQPLVVERDETDETTFDVVVGELQGEEAIVCVDDDDVDSDDSDRHSVQDDGARGEDVSLKIVKELKRASDQPARKGIPRLDLSAAALSQGRDSAAAERRPPGRRKKDGDPQGNENSADASDDSMKAADMVGSEDKDANIEYPAEDAARAADYLESVKAEAAAVLAADILPRDPVAEKQQAAHRRVLSGIVAADIRRLVRAADAKQPPSGAGALR